MHKGAYSTSNEKIEFVEKLIPIDIAKPNDPWERDQRILLDRRGIRHGREMVSITEYSLEDAISLYKALKQAILSMTPKQKIN